MFFNELTKDFDKDLLKEIKKISKMYFDIKIFDWEKFEINNEDFNKIKEISTKYLNGEDITFEIGYRYFRNSKLLLEKGVFVPQYDTEQIIDLVLSKNLVNGNALEIGSGSGAISISLSKETNLKIKSIDINPLAIELASKNSVKNNAIVDFELVDFFEFKTEEKFDLLISNPPYISINDKFVDKWVMDNQPKNALFAEDNGLIFYKYLFTTSIELLKSNGYIIVEIGYDQKEVLEKFLIENEIKIFEFHKDYEGHDRFLVVKKNE